MTVISCLSVLSTPYGTFKHDSTASSDLRVVYLWSAFGLALTGLFFAMGFGAGIGEALMAAG